MNSQNIISSYTADQGIDDGFLARVFPHRWNELTNGKPILATTNVVSRISFAGIMEIWNEYVTKAQTEEEKYLFTTKMNGEKVWVMDDGSVFTIMFPEDY